jgi:hypothetical protein
MATNSKQRKNHKKKVQARNQRLAEQKRKQEKFQREFIMNLIKQEQEKGLFDNAQNISGPILDNSIQSPMLNSIDISGPILDGPVIDSIVEDVDAVELIDTDDSDSTTEETISESKNQ